MTSHYFVYPPYGPLTAAVDAFVLGPLGGAAGLTDLRRGVQLSPAAAPGQVASMRGDYYLAAAAAVPSPLPGGVWYAQGDGAKCTAAAGLTPPSFVGQPLAALDDLAAAAGCVRSVNAITGPAGTPGAAGAAGNTVRTTTGVPANTVGANGDYALDPAAGVLYGPKAAGAWPGAGVSLVGPTGAAGVSPVFGPPVVTPLAAGATPTASLTGPSAAPVLTLELPAGPAGTARLLYASGYIAGNTIANTATETAFASQYTFAANALAAGQVVRVRMYGVYGTNLTLASTVTGRVKLNGSTVATTPLMTAVLSVSSLGWMSETYLMVTAAGSSGTLEAQGTAQFSTAATTALMVNLANAATVAVNTTAALTLTVTVQWGTAATANTITARMMTVEVMG